MLATIRDTAELQFVVGLILAVLAFGTAVYLVVHERWISALAAAVIGLIVVVALL